MALPQLYTCHRRGEIIRIDYDLLPDAMPAAGCVTNEQDLPHINRHQATLLHSLQRRALIEARTKSHPLHVRKILSKLSSTSRHTRLSLNSLGTQTCIGPALIALAALGDLAGVQELVHLRVNVDQSDNRGYT